MARPRAFDEDVALSAMVDVFWRKGFEAASYADLMAASGLGKGSLYAAFGDKAALFRAALTAYVEREIGALGAALLDETAAGEARIAAALDIVIDAVTLRGDRRGCFLCNAAVEAGALDEETQALVDQALDAGRDGFSTAVAAARGGGDGDEGATFFAVYLGMQVMARAGAPLEQLRAARDGALKRFE